MESLPGKFDICNGDRKSECLLHSGSPVGAPLSFVGHVTIKSGADSETNQCPCNRQRLTLSPTLQGRLMMQRCSYLKVAQSEAGQQVMRSLGRDQEQLNQEAGTPLCHVCCIAIV